MAREARKGNGRGEDANREIRKEKRPYVCEASVLSFITLACKTGVAGFAKDRTV